MIRKYFYPIRAGLMTHVQMILAACFAILSIIIVITGCSVYRSPVELSPTGIKAVEVFETKTKRQLRLIVNKDSIDTFIKLMNYNENTDLYIDSAYKLLLIKEVKEGAPGDTTYIMLSARGTTFSLLNIRKNPYGKVQSKQIETFRLTRSINDFLFEVLK